MGEMKEAIKLNPSFAAAHCLLGHMHVYAGHPEDAIPLVEKGMRLSPSDPDHADPPAPRRSRDRDDCFIRVHAPIVTVKLIATNAMHF